MHCSSGLIFLVFGFLIHSSCGTLPSYIKVCKANEPDLAKCIIDSVNALRPYLEKGIPELDVPPLEPLLLDEIKLRSGPSSTKIDANFTNVKVWGPSTYQILELKPDVKNMIFAFKILIPELKFKGNYEIDMNILFVKYKGSGPMEGSFTNYHADCLMKGHKIKLDDGNDYLKFDKMILKLDIGKSVLKMENLFHEDPIIAKATDEVIGDNTELFVNEIKPTLEKSLADKFTDISNKLTLKFTYQELFPED